jgi:hypothetical protein
LQAATEQKIQMSVTPYGAGRVDIEVSLHKGEMNAKIVTDGVLGTTDMHKQASHLVHEIMGDSTGIHNMSLMFHDGRSGYFFKKQKNIPFSGDTGNEPPAEVSNVQRSAGIHRVSIIA